MKFFENTEEEKHFNVTYMNSSYQECDGKIRVSFPFHENFM